MQKKNGKLGRSGNKGKGRTKLGKKPLKSVRPLGGIVTSKGG